MEDSRPTIESRIAELEAFVDGFKSRQKDRKCRYALEWYTEHKDKYYWKKTEDALDAIKTEVERRNKKETALAATSAVVGMIGMTIAAVAMFNKS